MPPVVLLRVLARVRRFARRCCAGAVYGAGVSWWCCWSLACTGYGLFLMAVTLILTTCVAALCCIIGGGDKVRTEG